MKIRSISLMVLTISAILAVHVVALAQSTSPKVQPHIGTAQKPVRVIGMDEYRKVVDNPGSALIIDVREPDEYAAGHVPGSINIPRGQIESQIWNHVEKTDLEKPIVLQCQAGRRASMAAQSLGALGFTQTKAVVMNLDDWQRAGHPFTK